jgi:hypothetical protein
MDSEHSASHPAVKRFARRTTLVLLVTSFIASLLSALLFAALLAIAFAHLGAPLLVEQDLFVVGTALAAFAQVLQIVLGSV